MHGWPVRTVARSGLASIVSLFLIKMILSIYNYDVLAGTAEGKAPVVWRAGAAKGGHPCPIARKETHSGARTARCEPCAACGPCALSSGRFGWPAMMKKFMPQRGARTLQPAPLPAPHQKLSQSSSAPAATGRASLGGALADLAAEGAAAAADAFLPAGEGVAVDRRVEVSLTDVPLDAGLPAGAAGTGRCAPVAPPPGCAARAWSVVSLNTATAPTKACA